MFDTLKSNPQVPDATTDLSVVSDVNASRYGLNKEEMDAIDRDGYIFNYNDTYTHGRVYKYKPADQLSIDFAVIPHPVEKNRYSLRVHVGNNQEKLASRWNRTLGRYLEVSDRNFPENYPMHLIANQVGEFVFMNEQFTFLRKRPDKRTGNNVRIALDVWKDIQKPIRSSTIHGRDLVVMRRFHNNYKADMIGKFMANRTVLDIGSGRGGDIRKWMDANVRRVFAIEPNAENRLEMESRIKASRSSLQIPEWVSRKGSRYVSNWIDEKIKRVFKLESIRPAERNRYIDQLKKTQYPHIHLLDMGAHDYNRLIANDDIEKAIYPTTPARDKITCVSSFFSLTYFFKKRKMITGLVKFLERLPAGARFIGAMMDGTRVRNLFEKSGTDVVENQAFTLRKLGAWNDETRIPADKEAAYGNKIEITIHDETSMVKDQVEYLTSMTELIARLDTVGYTLSMDSEHFLDQSYDENVFDKLNYHGRAFSRLNRYFVFTKRDVAPTMSTRQVTALSAASKYEQVDVGTDMTSWVLKFHGHPLLYSLGFVRTPDQTIPAYMEMMSNMNNGEAYEDEEYALVQTIATNRNMMITKLLNAIIGPGSSRNPDNETTFRFDDMDELVTTALSYYDILHEIDMSYGRGQMKTIDAYETLVRQSGTNLEQYAKHAPRQQEINPPISEEVRRLRAYKILFRLIQTSDMRVDTSIIVMLYTLVFNRGITVITRFEDQWVLDPIGLSYDQLQDYEKTYVFYRPPGVKFGFHPISINNQFDLDPMIVMQRLGLYEEVEPEDVMAIVREAHELGEQIIEAKINNVYEKDESGQYTNSVFNDQVERFKQLYPIAMQQKLSGDDPKVEKIQELQEDMANFMSFLD